MRELENTTYKEKVELAMFSPDTTRSYNNPKPHEMVLLTALLCRSLYALVMGEKEKA